MRLLVLGSKKQHVFGGKKTALNFFWKKIHVFLVELHLLFYTGSCKRPINGQKPRLNWPKKQLPHCNAATPWKKQPQLHVRTPPLHRTWGGLFSWWSFCGHFWGDHLNGHSTDPWVTSRNLILWTDRGYLLGIACLHLIHAMGPRERSDHGKIDRIDLSKYSRSLDR